MSLTKKQIEEYREKLGDSKYMKKAINGIADKFLTGCTMVELPYIAEPPIAEPEINNTEEREMAKNKWQDLNDHLFEQLEWLADRDETKGENLTREIKRAEAVVKVSDQILKGFDLYHRASSSVAKFGGKMKLPMMIEDKDK
jgi:hypothetical protein